ncbi:YbaK/EbsC family protein [Vibrio sp. FNV 38]|nr:YbaK/EbsC family protein [Vibrio sp. FNV 38]
MKNKVSTPVIDYLLSKRVDFSLLPQNTETISIEDTAIARGILPHQMVKSILLRDMSDRYALACLPGDCSVDPKKIRELLSWRRMTCVQLDQLERVTGYPVGAVTPILLKQTKPIIFEQSLTALATVTISSGHRLAGIALTPQDLISVCEPIIGHICRE